MCLAHCQLCCIFYKYARMIKMRDLIFSPSRHTLHAITHMCTVQFYFFASNERNKMQGCHSRWNLVHGQIEIFQVSIDCCTCTMPITIRRNLTRRTHFSPFETMQLTFHFHSALCSNFYTFHGQLHFQSPSLVIQMKFVLNYQIWNGQNAQRILSAQIV